MVRDVLLREQNRAKPHHPLPVDVAAGDGEPTQYRQWIGEVAQHFGPKNVGSPTFQLPSCWEFDAWRSRRVLGREAESAQLPRRLPDHVALGVTSSLPRGPCPRRLET